MSASLDQYPGSSIARLLNEGRNVAAAVLYRTAERYAPASQTLLTLSKGAEAVPVSLTTTPPGAGIYVSDYVAAAGDDLSEWRFLGESPLTTDAIPRWGYIRVRVLKDGFAPAERTYFGLEEPQLQFSLHAANETPAGMVWVPPIDATVAPPRAGRPVRLPRFWIDKYEVTNREFKAFVDAGSYQKEDSWRESVRDSRTCAAVARGRRQISRRH
jgi:eukaryotic-like serine/threonine-protein kinase